MTRLTSERGVSLMILILAITVFAGVAMGIVTLLRARYESYPYQVQSYQAYVLANAGVEFAIRFARENPGTTGDYRDFLKSYLPSTSPGKKFNFGNGSFRLWYVPGTGCGDALYSRGEYGTATREIAVSSLGILVAQAGGSPFRLGGAATISNYADAGSGYSGSKIEFDLYDCVQAAYPNAMSPQNNPSMGSGTVYGEIDGRYAASYATIAATLDHSGKQVVLARVGAPWSTGYNWMWDAACGSPGFNTSPPQCQLCSTAGDPSTCTTTKIGSWVYLGKALPAWDNISHPTPLSSEAFVINAAPRNSCCGGGSTGTWPTSKTTLTDEGDRPQTACSSDTTTCGSPWPPNCLFPWQDAGCGTGGRHKVCCTSPAIPCCPTLPLSYCIDLTTSTTDPSKTRTEQTCGGDSPLCGLCALNLQHAMHFVIETFGQVDTGGASGAGVTFYLQLPYSQFDFYGCVHGSGSGDCRPLGTPSYYSFPFTVH